jgi:hypothetical protein
MAEGLDFGALWPVPAGRFGDLQCLDLIRQVVIGWHCEQQPLRASASA